MKALYQLFLFSFFCFLTACAAISGYNDSNASSTSTAQRTGTPSPLNTTANPWTNVNPRIEAQEQAARFGSTGGRR